MVEKVTGYLTSEGKFYDNVVDARYHEALYQLRDKYQMSIYGGSIDFDQLLLVIGFLNKETAEYLAAKRDYLTLADAQEETEDDTNQEPDTIEV